MTHFFDYPRLPVHVQDEGGEAWLAVPKRLAGVTGTENSKSIRETLQHEHYANFLKRVKKRNGVAHWHPEVRATLLQPCTVLAIECWCDMLVRIVQRGVATGGCFCAMHVAATSVKLGFLGTTQPTVDVYCICGVCSTQLPWVRHWIPINWDVVVSWPVLGLGSLRTFSTRKERRHKKKQPRPAVVEGAGSDYAPPGTCEALQTRRVMPVRPCRLAQLVVLDPSASESDTQSSSLDSSDSQGESTGISGSESAQSSCSSSTDSDTQKAAPHSPPVPKPNPKYVTVHGTMGAGGAPPCPRPNPNSVTVPSTPGATRGPEAPPCPKPRLNLWLYFW